MCIRDRYYIVEEYISWEPNTVIYKFGDQSDYAYLLEKGAVEILSENGTKVGYVNAKEVFGEQSILLETPRTVTAVAIEKSSAVKIPKETLLKEFKESSILIRAILRSTYLRLTNLNTTITKDVKNFFDKIGTSIEINNEKLSNNFWAISGTMASFYELLKVLSDWLVKKGLKRSQAQKYVTSLYSALAELAEVHSSKNLKKIM